MKYCLTAYRVFQSLLTVKPMMTGCYQWVRVHKGDCQDYATLKENVDKYDVIQVNLDPMDIQLLPELKELTKNSSTIIVGNHDHSPELWSRSLENPVTFKHTVNECDAIFATSPTATNLLSNMLNREVSFIPHPCETHILKRFGIAKKFKHIVVTYHRYDNNVLMPAIMLKNIGMPITLAGYQESEDPRARQTKCLYDNILIHTTFPQFLNVLKEAYYVYDSYNGYSYGRIGCDTACLQTPLIGCEHVYSHQVLYPQTCVDQYDIKAIRSKMTKLMNDLDFYAEVTDYAYEHVEQFSHKNSRTRFKEMLDNVKQK